MKGCLKLRSRSPSPSHNEGLHCRKCVAFGIQITEVVHLADEWDRTPTEPTRKLTYQDLLELKEIQRSLPHANQPGDPLTGKPAKHYLSAVPIGLLPLLNESDDSIQSSRDNSASPSPVTSPRASSPTFPSIGLPTLEPPPVSPWAMNFQRPKLPPPRAPASAYRAPPHLAHLLPLRMQADKAKPRFAFLPLLDTPPSSAGHTPYPSNPPSRTPSPSPSDHEHDGDLTSDTDQSSLDPPTPSLTNASLDSSPPSRASSCSPEPSFFQLNSPNLKGGIGAYDSYFPAQDDMLAHLPPLHSFGNNPHLVKPLPASKIRLNAIPSPSLLPPSPLALEVHIAAPKPKPAKKRNFILVNDIEIELDDDDDDVKNAPMEDVKQVLDQVNVLLEQGQGCEDARSTTPTIDDTALSETNAQSTVAGSPRTPASSDPTHKLESAWSETTPSRSSFLSRPRDVTSPEPPATPTPSSPKMTTPTARTPSVSPPPRSPSYHLKERRLYNRTPCSSSPSLAAPVGGAGTTLNGALNLHRPIVFKRATHVAGGVRGGLY